MSLILLLLRYVSVTDELSSDYYPYIKSFLFTKKEKKLTVDLAYYYICIRSSFFQEIFFLGIVSKKNKRETSERKKTRYDDKALCAIKVLKVAFFQYFYPLSRSSYVK